jgi:phosphoribosylamine--glycine ligase
MAIDALMADGAAGAAGRRVVIQERLRGREVSAHAFSDGKTVVSMPLSCDHKPVFDGNRGPNTGGIGVYSPPWWAAPGLADLIRTRVTEPTIAGMGAEGCPFRGVLYPGIMVTDAGIRVLEYNARLGDPETQALLPRLKSDLLEIVWAIVNGRLDEVPVEWDESASVCVVLASGGYPGEYRTGLPILGLEKVDSDVQVFHAGTKRTENGSIVTAGGRVLNVVATGASLSEARETAYRNVERIYFEGMHFRRDIAATD